MTLSRDSERRTMNATRARQGRWGRQILWVLIFGTLLAALGMFAAWAWKFESHPGPVGSGQETVSGRATDTVAPPPAGQAYPKAPQRQP